MNQTILMIEDNLNILRLNRSVLTSRGYRVLEAETLKEGRTLLERETPSLIVLDIQLPDGDGLDFCEELRRKKSSIPVLLLTVLKEDEEIVAGLKRGGDDYLTKPYNMDVFLARVAALLRRAEQTAGATITRDALSLDTSSQTLRINGADAVLTQKEFLLLLYLIRNEGSVIESERLYAEVWGQSMAGDANAVRVAVSRLREKIQSSGYQITAERGYGYRFERSGE